MMLKTNASALLVRILIVFLSQLGLFFFSAVKCHWHSTTLILYKITAAENLKTEPAAFMENTTSSKMVAKIEWKFEFILWFLKASDDKWSECRYWTMRKLKKCFYSIGSNLTHPADEFLSCFGRPVTRQLRIWIPSPIVKGLGRPREIWHF